MRDQLRERVDDWVQTRRLSVDELREMLHRERDPETIHVIVMVMNRTEELLNEVQTILDETR